jgi:lysophospholipase L1-like esterase
MKTAIFRAFLSLCLLGCVCLGAPAEGAAFPFGDNIQLRGKLDNCRFEFERTGKGRVAFLGGSITERNGYRPLVCELLRKRFPDTTFTFINAGIASTTSITGAFRLQRDVLSAGPIDLLFVEFAVNDDQDGHYTRAECIRGMEGVIRHARRANQNTDIVMIYFVNPGMLQACQHGRTPLTIEAHGAVARHYGISTINVARELAAEIRAGTMTWKEYGGVHPAPQGNALCARMVGELFSRAWASPLNPGEKPAPHAMPARPLDSFSYFAGRFVSPNQAKVVSGWTFGVPDWKTIPGAKRARFNTVPMLCATKPGAQATFTFSGTAVGAYILAGPDAGMAEASIDGGPFKAVDLYHLYSKDLQYPCTVMLADGLKPGPHTLTLRLSPKTRSAGHAMRIMEFGVN